MSLVGMLTAIDVLKQSINNNFSFLGANTFIIRNKSNNVKIGRRSPKQSNHPAISFDDARAFQERFSFPSKISISAFASATAVIQHGSEKTHPNVSLNGGDENYVSTAGFEVEAGRNFNSTEMQSAADVVIIGKDIADLLFPSSNPLEKQVLIGSRRYMVIGVLKKAGSGLNMGRDRTAVIPISNLRSQYATGSTSYVINVMVANASMMSPAVTEAIGLFRGIRKVPLNKYDNFEIVRSDNLINTILDMTGYISLGAIVIGLITMFGAVIGLVNIMLVAVNERTREIGVRKAIGATRRNITLQFLIEAIVICQLGGFLGVIFGMLVGNAMTFVIGGSFIIPWNWIILSVVLCVVVGITAGIYPAIKAARLDPVEALRYE
jgi:putative ABC transport system permease protein